MQWKLIVKHATRKPHENEGEIHRNYTIQLTFCLRWDNKWMTGTDALAEGTEAKGMMKFYFLLHQKTLMGNPDPKGRIMLKRASGQS